jgi:hypothetical protein
MPFSDNRAIPPLACFVVIFSSPCYPSCLFCMPCVITLAYLCIHSGGCCFSLNAGEASCQSAVLSPEIHGSDWVPSQIHSKVLALGKPEKK